MKSKLFLLDHVIPKKSHTNLYNCKFCVRNKDL